MTRKEAQQALAQGRAITHNYFGPGEYVKKHRLSFLLTDETGATLDAATFWKLRESKVFDEGWHIIEHIKFLAHDHGTNWN